MKNTKVSKLMLSLLVIGGLLFTSLCTNAMQIEVEAPSSEKRETQIELPSSALFSPEQSFKDIKAEGEKLQHEREEKLRIEREKARLAEEARLAKIEAERKAKEEAERKAREEVERKRQAELQRQREIERQKQIAIQQQQAQRLAQQQAQPQKQAQSTNGVAFNGSYYTAYCPEGCTGVTATGYNVSGSIYVDGMRVIAVDPRVIPLYSIVEVSTPYETFKAIALDTGGAIKGHKVDILVANEQTASNLGRHTVYIKVLRSGK
ncbi:3D domain-containing protein [Lysinibacillus xylanilyticus]|uniref:3D domain-containing protein n=1 Tax=Lysinibacillus xylanilyticus TaxID=582475 RepID=UPI00381445EA